MFTPKFHNVIKFDTFVGPLEIMLTAHYFRNFDGEVQFVRIDKEGVNVMDLLSVDQIDRIARVIYATYSY